MSWPELVTIPKKGIVHVNRAEVDRIKAEYVGMKGADYTRD